MTGSAGDETSGLIRAFALDGRGGGTALDWDAIKRWRSDDGVLWVDLDYSTPSARAWLADPASIDPLVRDALLDPDPRPRAAAHGDALLLIVRGVNLNPGAAPEDMISVRAYIEPRRIVTMRRRMSSSLRALGDDVARGVGPYDAGALVAGLVDRIVDHVTTRVDTLGDEVAACEDQVLVESRHDLRATLADQRRRAIALRRFLGPQREALAKLIAIPMPWLDAAHRARITEAADRMTRTVEELDAARDRAAVTQEELGSRVAEVTNQRLYVLSLITAVFLPLGFVCSLLSVPLSHDAWRFWALVGAFVVGGTVQIWLLRRRGWL